LGYVASCCALWTWWNQRLRILASSSKKEKGTALGINGSLGNMGVSVVQFVTPLIITTGVFGAIDGEGQVLADGTKVWLENTAFILVIPIIFFIILAYFGMDNLSNAKQSVSEQFVIVKRKHT
jgi:MFS transporter, NNP family, nitrate/nitrite transporter